MNQPRRTINQLVESFKNGSLLPSAHADKLLQLANQQNSKIRALTYVDQLRIVQDAKERDRQIRAGKPCGPLHGAIYSAKDNIKVAGMPGSQGSKMGQYKEADCDSRLIGILRQAGALCIGKGNMPEYGKSVTNTENEIFGRTLNPINLDFSPGGSTGGDAAALAAGFSDFAIGGDSGGSIRVPAQLCGLYGILPTNGILSDSPGCFISSSITKTFGSIGLLTTCLADLELLLPLLVSLNELDPLSIPVPSSWKVPAGGKRKIASFSKLLGLSADQETCNALSTTLKKLTGIGYEIEEVLPIQFEQCLEPFVLLAGQAALIQEDQLCSQSGSPRNLSLESTIVKRLRTRIATELPPLTVEMLLMLQAKVLSLRREIAEWFTNFDAIVCPISANHAVKYDSPLSVDGTDVDSTFAYHFVRVANVLGLPAISFPVTTSQAGLPIGLQIIGPRFSEWRLIDILKHLTDD